MACRHSGSPASPLCWLELEYLGLNRPDIFASATSHFNGSVDIHHLPDPHVFDTEGRVSRVFEVVFHANEDLEGIYVSDLTDWRDLETERDEI